MQFYRKPHTHSRLKNLIRGILKNKRRTLSILAGIFLVSYALFGNHGILVRIRLERQRSEMIQKLQQAEEETTKLQAQIKALESDKRTIEKIAREKYGMARPGETVYRVRKD